MEISLEIPSSLGEEKYVMQKIEGILIDLNCRESDILDIKTAVSEACLNAIEHGNGLNADALVKIYFQIVNNTVSIEVCDCGKGAELYAFIGDPSSKKEKFNGWGLFIINRLMDTWEYKTQNNMFCVRMEKNIVKAGNIYG